MSKESIKKVLRMKATLVDKVVDESQRYGLYQELDKLVDSSDVSHRLLAVSYNYGLDKLKDDADPRVRVEVAKKGYYRSLFLKDSHLSVRKAAIIA